LVCDKDETTRKIKPLIAGWFGLEKPKLEEHNVSEMGGESSKKKKRGDRKIGHFQLRYVVSKEGESETVGQGKELREE